MGGGFLVVGVCWVCGQREWWWGCLGWVCNVCPYRVWLVLLGSKDLTGSVHGSSTRPVRSGNVPGSGQAGRTWRLATWSRWLGRGPCGSSGRGPRRGRTHSRRYPRAWSLPGRPCPTLWRTPRTPAWRLSQGVAASSTGLRSLAILAQCRLDTQPKLVHSKWTRHV